MKKIIVFLCLSVLIAGITSCGNKNQSQSGTNAADTVESTTQDSEESTDTAELPTQSSEETADIDISAGWSGEMEAIKAAVVEALGENYWPDTKIDPEMMEAVYGITQDMFDDYMGERPMISVNVDTLLVVKAKEDKIDAVEEALNAYRDTMVGDTMQYPMNLGKIQASRIQTYGRYVCFVQLGADTMEASENGEEAVIQQCQEQNELALEVIGRNIPQ